METSTSTERTAIAKLLQSLLKYGTLPNVPVPEYITNCYTELAGYEIQIDVMKAELAALRAQLAAVTALVDEWKSRANSPAYAKYSGRGAEWDDAAEELQAALEQSK